MILHHQTTQTQSKIEPGVYLHYKGKYYLVHFSAIHTETHEDMVVYQCLYGNFMMSVRPLAMFFDPIEYNNLQQPRFKKVAESSEFHAFLNER